MRLSVLLLAVSVASANPLPGAADCEVVKTTVESLGENEQALAYCSARLNSRDAIREMSPRGEVIDAAAPKTKTITKTVTGKPKTKTETTIQSGSYTFTTAHTPFKVTSTKYVLATATYSCNAPSSTAGRRRDLSERKPLALSKYTSAAQIDSACECLAKSLMERAEAAAKKTTKTSTVTKTITPTHTVTDTQAAHTITSYTSFVTPYTVTMTQTTRAYNGRPFKLLASGYSAVDGDYLRVGTYQPSAGETESAVFFGSAANATVFTDNSVSSNQVGNLTDSRTKVKATTDGSLVSFNKGANDYLGCIVDIVSSGDSECQLFCFPPGVSGGFNNWACPPDSSSDNAWHIYPSSFTSACSGGIFRNFVVSQ